MSRIDGFAIAQHARIDANLRSGRSCDRKLIRATSDVTTCECLTVNGIVVGHVGFVPEKLEEGGLAAVDREDGEQKPGLLQRGLSTRDASRECWLSVPLWGGGMT